MAISLIVFVAWILGDKDVLKDTQYDKPEQAVKIVRVSRMALIKRMRLVSLLF